MKLGIIVASTRPTRVGHLIGQWVHERAVEHDKFDIELLDLANLPLYEEPTISRRAFTSCWAVTGASAVHPIPVLRRSRCLALEHGER